MERAKKSHADKVKTITDEMTQSREELESEYKEKHEDQSKTHKKDKERAIDKAVEKVRSDLRNQIDSVKNELAKAKADWQRERKKLVQEHETSIESTQKDQEMEKDTEIRQVKEKTEKIWKKKLDEREK